MVLNSKTNKKINDFFVNTGSIVNYSKGNVIMRPDDPPTGIYFLKKGHVRIYSITYDGTEKLHIIYKPNDIFPLAWALKNEQKKLFYEAMDDVTLFKIKKNDFLNAVKSNHAYSLELLELVVENFSIFSDRIDDLEISKTYPRTISCLLFFVKQFGKPITINKNTSYIIMAPITHQDIANFSSMTRETTSREMSVLEKKNLISYKKHLIVVNDLQGLQQELRDI